MSGLSLKVNSYPCELLIVIKNNSAHGEKDMSCIICVPKDYF